MATNDTYVFVGPAIVHIGEYVTAGGTQSTMVDVGHTKAPVTVNTATEVFEAMSERASAPVKVIPLTMKMLIKVPAMEIRGDVLRWAFSQPLSNMSGTHPTQILNIGLMVEQYYQVEITTPGPKIKLWRAAMKINGDWPIAKSDTEVVELEITGLEDSSVLTTDRIGKVTLL